MNARFILPKLLGSRSLKPFNDLVRCYTIIAPDGYQFSVYNGMVMGVPVLARLTVIHMIFFFGLNNPSVVNPAVNTLPEISIFNIKYFKLSKVYTVEGMK